MQDRRWNSGYQISSRYFHGENKKNLLAPAESLGSPDPSISDSAKRSSLFPWMQLQRWGQGLTHGYLTACICSCLSHTFSAIRRGLQPPDCSYRVSHKRYVCLIIYLTAYNGGPGKIPLKVEVWLQPVKSYLLQDQQRHTPQTVCVQFHSSFLRPLTLVKQQPPLLNGMEILIRGRDFIRVRTE